MRCQKTSACSSSPLYMCVLILGQIQHLVFRAMVGEGSLTLSRSPGRRSGSTLPIRQGRSSRRHACREGLMCRGPVLHRRRAASRAVEKGMLPGKLRHRRQGGDGHGGEATPTRRSMSELSTRRVIGDNVEASHRGVAAPVANMRQRACRGSTLAVKA